MSYSNQIFRYSAHQHGKKVTLVDLLRNRKFTAEMLLSRGNRLAYHFKYKYGIKKNDIILVLSHNTSDYFDIFAACFQLGTTLFSTSIDYPYELISTLIKPINQKYNIACVIYEKECRQLFDRLNREFKFTNSMITDTKSTNNPFEKVVTESPRLTSYTTLTPNMSLQLVHTSGSSGLPKICDYSVNAIIKHMERMFIDFDVSSSSNQLVVHQLYHMAGLHFSALAILLAGGKVYLYDGRFADTLINKLANPEYGITHFLAHVPHYQAIAKHPDFNNIKIPSAQLFLVAGTFVPNIVYKTWHNKNLPLDVIYGGSEFFLITKTTNEKKTTDQPSVGKPVYNVDIRLTGIHDHKVIRSPNKMGIIWVKTETKASNYINQPKRYLAMRWGPWLNTEDVGMYNENGELVMLDRLFNLYQYNDELIVPSYMENVLFNDEEIADAAVVGIKHLKHKNAGLACIVHKHATQKNQAVYRLKLLEKLHNDQRHGKSVLDIIFMDALPYTPNNKVDKNRLQSYYHDHFSNIHKKAS